MTSLSGCLHILLGQLELELKEVLTEGKAGHPLQIHLLFPRGQSCKADFSRMAQRPSFQSWGVCAWGAANRQCIVSVCLEFPSPSVLVPALLGYMDIGGCLSLLCDVIKKEKAKQKLGAV